MFAELRDEDKADAYDEGYEQGQLDARTGATWYTLPDYHEELYEELKDVLILSKREKK